MTYALRWLLVTLILTGNIEAAAADEGRSLTGAYTEFQPLTYTDDRGQPAGTHLEKANQLARQAGYDIQWQSLPIDRIFLYLREGNIDVWLGSSEVPVLAEWTREPAFTLRPIHLNAYYTEDTPAIDDLADLKGESLILIRGYTYRDRLKPVTEAPRTRVGTAPDHEAGLRMLKAQRGDYLLDFEAPVEAALESEPLPDINKHVLMQWDTSLVFSKRTNHLDRIIQDFEAAWHPRTSPESPKRASDERSRSPEADGSLHGSTTGPD